MVYFPARSFPFHPTEAKKKKPTQRISLKETFERKEALEREAKESWEQMAEKLARRIPEGLRTFALETGWINTPGWWKLPEFLQNTVTYTKIGSCSNDKYHESPEDLAPYGFKDLEDAIKKFKELGHAWAGTITVKIVRRELNQGVLYVEFYATEFIDEGKKAIIDEGKKAIRRKA